MHIAICDDNIADRMQLERLLTKESDARINDTGVFYIDSFGNSASLFTTPMSYDLFFLDMVSSESNGLELAHRLRGHGVTAPIVLCSSVIDYKSMNNQPSTIFHMEKPIIPVLLTETINNALQHKEYSSVHTVEVRCESETVYVDPSRIVLAKPDRHLCRLLLDDNTELKMLGTLNDFYYLVESTGRFIFAKNKLVVNMNFISAMKGFHLKLKNGMTIFIWLNDIAFIRQHWAPEAK